MGEDAVDRGRLLDRSDEPHRPGAAWAHEDLAIDALDWLFILMRFGYAKERYRKLSTWAERAWATGNPALDYVGTGGGTFLAPRDFPDR